MILFTILLLFTSYVIWCILWFLYKYYQNVVAFQNHPQPGKRHVIYGHLKQHPGACYEAFTWLLDWANKTPAGFHVFWFGPFPNVSVFSGKAAKQILSTSEPKHLGSTGYGFTMKWIGMGLLLNSGSSWKRRRKMITPAFHFNILKQYIKIMISAADHLITRLQELDSEPVELFDIIPAHTLEVILRSAFSYDTTNFQTRNGAKQPYLAAVKRLTELIVRRFFNLFVYPDATYRLTSNGREFSRLCDYVHSVSRNIIMERAKHLERGGDVRDSKKLDFIDILLTHRDEHGNGLSVEEIAEETDTFLFEGHDTTSSGICFILACLALHVQWQARCRDELEQVLLPGDDINSDVLSKLPVLTCVIRETLRLYPPVPFIKRRMTQNYELSGYKIPANSLATVAIYAVHRDKSMWGDDADEFKPERFQDFNPECKESFHYIPFSAGTRNCIGQNFAMNELKITVAKILQRFRIEKCWEGDEIPRHQPAVTLTKEDPFRVKFISL